MSEVLSATNLKFLAARDVDDPLLVFLRRRAVYPVRQLFSAVMRNGKNPILRWIASIYVEFVRNVPNLLWIFIIFLALHNSSQPRQAITSFTVFTSAALAEIIRGGLKLYYDHGQTEAGLSQGFNNKQIFIHISLPTKLFVRLLPSIISQFVTVIKDTSFLYSVIALQELFGKSQILMGGYYEPSQTFTLYGIVAPAYFVVNFAISSYSRYLLF